MIYDNSTYWNNIHKNLGCQLKAVGHPWLSEEFNKLKYKSETNTVLETLAKIEPELIKKGKVSFLDIGTGIGYWTNLFHLWLKQEGLFEEGAALDISIEALKSIKSRYPWVTIVKEDLKKISPERFADKFDIVLSFYCLHHLVNINDYLNALKFSAKSVRKDGYLIIMDPILTMPFSYFNSVDFNDYSGNGLPRSLFLNDNILYNENMKREIFKPAVSFLLNGAIEARSRITFNILNLLWNFMMKFYKSNRFVIVFNKILTHFDSLLKRKKISYSSSITIYKKV